MRILVYPHDLELGGSQLNAIEIAAAVRDRGHDVIVFGRRGALNARIDALGLEFVDAPAPGRRPSPTTARALVELVRRREIDVLHGYEWPPTLDAVLAARSVPDVRVVSTVMSMSVPPFVPRSVDLIVGTEQIAEAERQAGRARVSVLEPPVDLTFNDGDAEVGAGAFRARWGVRDDEVLVVAVTRLAHELKLEGILTAIDAMRDVPRNAPVRLIVVGDGPAADTVGERAAAVNDELGHARVILTGGMLDPRPAYAAADVAIGMGGSALRALAYGAPLIVQGERGYWRTLTPDSLPEFLWAGWYGIGAETAAGSAAFHTELSPLLIDPALRERLARFGRRVVAERFSTEGAADRQLARYEEAMARPTATDTAAEAAALARYARYYALKRMRRLVRRERSDDFNARPVALTSAGRRGDS
ncbi:glycosyltransferase [Microbacterium telephonicum]|uniref:D-inositol 3-phosphate glycosyltransferase n=1 Tax=Microbacterium telephonicum TaxID=1714841 RepID=A0A498C5R3_9MICO|nr:glycosyltransferase [Microbacterium telephonicum]RLK47948.1 glycosyltransferase involved in cell wall biosynthesis [Microbacterium telephonicum]